MINCFSEDDVKHSLGILTRKCTHGTFSKSFYLWYFDSSFLGFGGFLSSKPNSFTNYLLNYVVSSVLSSSFYLITDADGTTWASLHVHISVIFGSTSCQ